MSCSHKLLVIHLSLYSVLIFCLATPTTSQSFPSSDDKYLEEIKAEVLFPCYRYMMQLNQLKGFVTVEQFYEYMKATDRVTRLAEETLLKQIRRKPRWERERIYQKGLNSCVLGVHQGRVR